MGLLSKKCGHCGAVKESTEMAQINDTWYCHDSSGETCYMWESGRLVSDITDLFGLAI